MGFSLHATITRIGAARTVMSGDRIGHHRRRPALCETDGVRGRIPAAREWTPAPKAASVAHHRIYDTRHTVATWGLAAGRQGEITIHAECDGTALNPNFVILAHASAGVRTQVYRNLNVPATCTVTETQDGRNSLVGVALVE